MTCKRVELVESARLQSYGVRSSRIGSGPVAALGTRISVKSFTPSRIGTMASRTVKSSRGLGSWFAAAPGGCSISQSSVATALRQTERGRQAGNMGALLF
jgi:hypothetical protein